MSARRVEVLTRQLPHGCRTFVSQDEDSVWTADRILTGLVVERLDNLLYATVKVNGGKAKKPSPLVPRPKPAQKKAAAKAKSTASLLDDLDKALGVAADG